MPNGKEGGDCNSWSEKKKMQMRKGLKSGTAKREAERTAKEHPRKKYGGKTTSAIKRGWGREQTRLRGGLKSHGNQKES